MSLIDEPIDAAALGALSELFVRTGVAKMAERVDGLADARRVVVRFCAPPAASGPWGMTLEGYDAVRAVGRILLSLRLDPSRLIAQRVQSQGLQVALVFVPDEAEGGRRARVAAFVIEGLSEIELSLALAWWETKWAERDDADA